MAQYTTHSIKKLKEELTNGTCNENGLDLGNTNVTHKDKCDVCINIGYDGSYYKQFDYNTPEYLKYITEAEDKAIHKKIEELKGGEQ